MRKRDELSDPNSCMSRAADDEWTFVLLGRDLAAPTAIRAWAAERIRQGKNTAEDAQIAEALACAARMELERDPHVTSAEDRRACPVCEQDCGPVAIVDIAYTYEETMDGFGDGGCDEGVCWV